LENAGIDEKIILKRIFEKWGRGHGLDPSVSGYTEAADFCKCGDESSSSIKCGEFLE
jgi:hypothetical protein